MRYLHIHAFNCNVIFLLPHVPVLLLRMSFE